MPFLFQIFVEKNLRGENLCGEKMTNMRSDAMPCYALVCFHVIFDAIKEEIWKAPGALPGRLRLL